MIRTRRSLPVFGLVTFLVCSAPAGTEPNDARAALTFEVASMELPAPQFVRVYASPLPSWKGTVTYAAGVMLNDTPYFLRPGGPYVDSFIAWALNRDFSEEQRRFLARTHAELERPRYYTPPGDPNSTQQLLYAVSLDDAKKMAAAYLEFSRDRYRHGIAPVQKEVKSLSERLADEQEKQPGAIRAAEAAEKAFQDLAKQVPYRDDKQALDAAAELDRMLNTAQVDIAGIQAALKAIQDQSKTLSSNVHPLKSKLEAMFVEESIALQAAEARKHMATTLRKQADGYIDLKQAMQSAAQEKDRIAHSISTLPEMIRQAQARLAGKIREEPRILNNRVFLYPVKQPAEPAGN